MKTYQEYIEIYSKEIFNNYLGGGSDHMFVAPKYISQIYEINEDTVNEDIQNGFWQIMKNKQYWWGFNSQNSARLTEYVYSSFTDHLSVPFTGHFLYNVMLSDPNCLTKQES